MEEKTWIRTKGAIKTAVCAGAAAGTIIGYPAIFTTSLVALSITGVYVVAGAATGTVAGVFAAASYGLKAVSREVDKLDKSIKPDDHGAKALKLFCQGVSSIAKKAADICYDDHKLSIGTLLLVPTGFCVANAGVLSGATAVALASPALLAGEAASGVAQTISGQESSFIKWGIKKMTGREVSKSLLGDFVKYLKTPRKSEVMEVNAESPNISNPNKKLEESQAEVKKPLEFAGHKEVKTTAHMLASEISRELFGNGTNGLGIKNQGRLDDKKKINEMLAEVFSQIPLTSSELIHINKNVQKIAANIATGMKNEGLITPTTVDKWLKTGGVMLKANIESKDHETMKKIVELVRKRDFKTQYNAKSSTDSNNIAIASSAAQQPTRQRN